MGIYWDASMNHTYIYICIYTHEASIDGGIFANKDGWIIKIAYIYNYINDNSNNNDYWVAQPMELLPKTGW